MTNLELYRKVCTLKSYLEIHELDQVGKERLIKAVSLVNEVFMTLERRKGAR